MQTDPDYTGPNHVAPPSPLPLYRAVVVPSQGLNVRSGPGVNNYKVKALRQGEPVEVWATVTGAGTSSRWAAINPTHTHWVSEPYLKKV